MSRSPFQRTPLRRSDVAIAERRVLHDGYGKIVRYALRFALHKGGQSPRMEREVFFPGNASMVMPYDPVRDEVLLIEQFRMGPLEQGDPCPWPIECVAGRLHEGEDAQDAARREAQEEAGVTLGRVESVCFIYPSPGSTGQRYHLFVGEADLSAAGGIHGLAEEDEDIRVIVTSFDDAYAGIADGRANTASVVIPLQWLALNRARLREDWTRPDEA